MSTPVLLEDYGSGYATLRCPTCNEDYLHQTDVAVFGRVEDEDQVRVTTVTEKGTHEAVITNDLSLNPSPRRYGLRISFWCEHCEQVPDLGIYQHKGNTFIEWMD
jgi:hypothetical protein